jgi:hypothetical protein
MDHPVVAITEKDQVPQVGLLAMPQPGSKLQAAAGLLLAKATIVTRLSSASGVP